MFTNCTRQKSRSQFDTAVAPKPLEKSESTTEITRMSTNEASDQVLFAASSKPNLVLDLDETLLHSSLQMFAEHQSIIVASAEDNAFSRASGNRRHTPFYIAARSGAKEFVKLLAESFRIHIWTSASASYAQAAIDFLGIRRYVGRVLTLSNCLYSDGYPLKVLSQAGFDPQNTILIDDQPRQVEANPGSAIQVPEFRGEKDDYLGRLARYLIISSTDFDTKRICAEWK